MSGGWGLQNELREQRMYLSMGWGAPSTEELAPSVGHPAHRCVSETEVSGNEMGL